MISDKGCAPASPQLCLVRLSVRLSRKDFSPRTAPVLFKPPPAELDPDDESGWTEVPLLSTLDVSIVRPGWLGDLPCLWRSDSWSSQLAGVGGTGPSAVTPLGGGRLVGGDTIGSVVRLRLCDLDWVGGGPGGGGGSGMPGSHLDCEVDLDRAEVGVSIALAEAARRALGGIAD